MLSALLRELKMQHWIVQPARGVNQRPAREKRTAFTQVVPGSIGNGCVGLVLLITEDGLATPTANNRKKFFCGERVHVFSDSAQSQSLVVVVPRLHWRHLGC